AAHRLHGHLGLGRADHDVLVPPAGDADLAFELAVEVAAHAAEPDVVGAASEPEIDVPADRLEAMVAGLVELAVDPDLAAHRDDLGAVQAHPLEREIAAHRVRDELAGVVGHDAVAAHGLQAEGTLDVVQPHVARHALRLERPARADELKVAAHGVRFDPDLTRHRDLEVHRDATAAEQIGPPAILLVQVRLEGDVVALLVHAHLDVLEEPLRPLLARTADAL